MFSIYERFFFKNAMPYVIQNDWKWKLCTWSIKLPYKGIVNLKLPWLLKVFLVFCLQVARHDKRLGILPITMALLVTSNFPAVINLRFKWKWLPLFLPWPRGLIYHQQATRKLYLLIFCMIQIVIILKSTIKIGSAAYFWYKWGRAMILLLKFVSNIYYIFIIYYNKYYIFIIFIIFNYYGKCFVNQIKI